MRNRTANLLSFFLALVLLSSCLPAAAMASGGDVRPGYCFYFGFFEQDGFSSDGPEPIVWRVLDTEDSSGLVLAVSEYGLYTMKYNRTNNRTAWGDTDVRNWLNSAFLSSFTPEERSYISVTRVSGSPDSFFLLDSAQITRYLSSPYLCYATPWALAHGEDGAYVNSDTGASSWLVRTDTACKRIAWVGGAGQLYSPEGKKGVNYLTSKDNVVRPAMWISREAIGNEAYSFGFPLYARTLMRISTRSGPTTGYNGLGDYFNGGGEIVKVISRVFDGSIWWLEIEFEYKGAMVRCFTGLKRVDVNISRVPDEVVCDLGTGVVLDSSAASYGPGNRYKKQSSSLLPPVGTAGSVIKEENGWYCLEYDRGKELSRVWLPCSAVDLR